MITVEITYVGIHIFPGKRLFTALFEVFFLFNRRERTEHKEAVQGRRFHCGAKREVLSFFALPAFFAVESGTIRRVGAPRPTASGPRFIRVDLRAFAVKSRHSFRGFRAVS
jgi:hypothetical protein